MLQITRSTLWRTSVSSHFNTRDLFTFFGIRLKELKDYERPGHCISGVYIFQPSVIFSVRWAQMWAGAGEEGPWLWRGCTLVRLWPLCGDLALQSSVFVRPPVSSTGQHLWEPHLFWWTDYEQTSLFPVTGWWCLIFPKRYFCLRRYLYGSWRYALLPFPGQIYMNK